MRVVVDSVGIPGLYANLSLMVGCVAYVLTLVGLAIKKCTDAKFKFAWGPLSICLMSVLLNMGKAFKEMSQAEDQQLGNNLSFFSEELDELLAPTLQQAAMPHAEVGPEQDIHQVSETTYPNIHAMFCYSACCVFF